MSEVILGIPSKGRLKEQVEAWLADAGLKLEADGGERGYRARIAGLDGLEVRLISAGEIARALSGGDAHLGITGEDLLREQGDDFESRLLLLRGLGDFHLGDQRDAFTPRCCCCCCCCCCLGGESQPAGLAARP